VSPIVLSTAGSSPFVISTGATGLPLVISTGATGLPLVISTGATGGSAVERSLDYDALRAPSLEMTTKLPEATE
jgi:hypothetical protein